MVDPEGLFLNGSNGVSRWADKLHNSNGVSRWTDKLNSSNGVRRWADKQREAPNPALPNFVHQYSREG